MCVILSIPHGAKGATDNNLEGFWLSIKLVRPLAPNKILAPLFYIIGLSFIVKGTKDASSPYMPILEFCKPEERGLRGMACWTLSRPAAFKLSKPQLTLRRVRDIASLAVYVKQKSKFHEGMTFLWDCCIFCFTLFGILL